MEPIVLDCNLTENEYVAATRLWNARRTNSFFYVFFAFVIFLIGFVSLFSYRENIFGAVFAAAGSIAFFYLSYCCFFYPRIFFRKLKTAEKFCQYEFGEEEILVRMKDAESRIEWSFLSKYWETKDFYFLQHNGLLFTFLPKRVFASERQQIEFINLLAVKGIESVSANRWLEPQQKTSKIKEYVPPQSPPDWRQDD